MRRPGIGWRILLLGTLGWLVGSASGEAAAVSTSVLAEASCEGSDGARVAFQLVEKAQGKYSRPRAGKKRVWERSISLERFRARNLKRGSEVWSSEENVAAGYVGPNPRIVGALACRSRSRETGLDIFLVLIKRPFHEEGFSLSAESVWFYHFRFFDGGESVYIVWSHREAEMPNWRGFRSEFQVRLFEEPGGVLAELRDRPGGEGHRRFFYYFDVERRTIARYLPEHMRSAMFGDSVPAQPAVATFDPLDKARQAFRCESLEDCTTVRDPCGGLQGVRREFYGDYVAWARTAQWHCAYISYDSESCVENLACDEGECKVRWRSRTECPTEASQRRQMGSPGEEPTLNEGTGGRDEQD